MDRMDAGGNGPRRTGRVTPNLREMSVATIIAIAIAAAAVAGLCMVGAAFLVARATRRSRALDREIERGKAVFADVLSRESTARAAELAQTLKIARAESLSLLAGEERRSAEERRQAVAKHEAEASARLGVALAKAQRAVDQRFADWAADLHKLQQSVSGEIERIKQRQEEILSGMDSRVTSEAERLKSAIEDHRAAVARFRGDREQDNEELSRQVAADLESHTADRRRALSEMSERLQKREVEFLEQVERSMSEAVEQMSANVADVERRQLEQWRRAMSRQSQHAAEAASVEFDNHIRTAREEAARRLGRELDLAVERFAREANGMLAQRVDSEIRHVEERIEALSRRLDTLTARQ